MKRTHLIPIFLLTHVIVFQLPPHDCLAGSSIRISQVYGGGGNTGAIYQNDFIELFNASASPVNVTGWSIQYAAATSSIWHATNLSGIINAGGYYLIQMASGGAVGITLPSPDATGTTNMSATDGKVALVNNTATLSNGCPSDISIIDLVGYGTTAGCYEGAGAAPTASNTESVIRTSDGCLDTDNNSSDFTKGAPNPHNSFSSTNLCSLAGIIYSDNYSAIKVWSSQNKLNVDFSKMKAVNATIDVLNILGQTLSSEKFSGNCVYTKEIRDIESPYILARIINGSNVIIKKLIK